MGKYNEYTPSSSGDWLNLQDGDNKIRIVSDFEAFGNHYDNETRKPITCVGMEKGCDKCLKAEKILSEMRDMRENQSPTKADEKKLEKLAEDYRAQKARVQFMVRVIDRADGQVKLLTYGATVQSQISKLSKSEEYSFDDLPSYDMTINKSGKDLDTKYTVLPARNDTKLTEEEEKMIKDEVRPIKEIIDAMKKKSNSDTPNVEKKEDEIDVKQIDFDGDK